MSLKGYVCNGSMDVFVCKKGAARKTEAIDHPGLIAEGAKTVLVNSKPAARVFDRYLCKGNVAGVPHVGGIISFVNRNVLAEGMPMAVRDDVTFCFAGSAGDKFDDLNVVKGGLADLVGASDCGQLWGLVEQEALDVLGTTDGNHRQRNHAINAGYASLARRNPDYAWAGLAVYASKQVGCAMDHAQKSEDKLRRWADDSASSVKQAAYRGMAASVREMHDSLGGANRRLFLDIYPTHRFHEEFGFDKLMECANARVPPVPIAALDGFRLLEKYKKRLASHGNDEEAKTLLGQHIEAIAWHEQLTVLQDDVYQRTFIKALLRSNQFGDIINPEDLMKPADVRFQWDCGETAKSIPFGKGARQDITHVPSRMDWILDEVTPEYMKVYGTERQAEDIALIEERAKTAGAAVDKVKPKG